MIFVTGDCHGDFTRFKTRIFPEQKQMTKDDYVIILGDFGGIWKQGKSDFEERIMMDRLQSKPFTTLFIDGNHENFDRLDAIHVEEWHGGKVHKIRPSVIHLMRGQYYEIGGRTFFTFGGAQCHETNITFLEPSDTDFESLKRELESKNLYYRVHHTDWWEREMPSEKEMLEGIANLAAHDNTVDFILTHCCSTSTQTSFEVTAYPNNFLTDYLEKIKHLCTYRKWLFGHYHDNFDFGNNEILLYEQIIRIS